MLKCDVIGVEAVVAGVLHRWNPSGISIFCLQGKARQARLVVVPSPCGLSLLFLLLLCFLAKLLQIRPPLCCRHRQHGHQIPSLKRSRQHQHQHPQQQRVVLAKRGHSKEEEGHYRGHCGVVRSCHFQAEQIHCHALLWRCLSFSGIDNDDFRVWSLAYLHLSSFTVSSSSSSARNSKMVSFSSVNFSIGDKKTPRGLIFS